MGGRQNVSFCLLACCCFYVRKLRWGGFVPSPRFSALPPGQAKGSSLIQIQCRKHERSLDCIRTQAFFFLSHCIIFGCLPLVKHVSSDTAWCRTLAYSTVFFFLVLFKHRVLKGRGVCLIRLSLGKLSVNLLQVVKRTNTPLIT